MATKKPIEPSTDQMSEGKKARLSLEWLAYCRDAGWPADKKTTAALIDVFWDCEGWRTFKGFPQ